MPKLMGYTVHEDVMDILSEATSRGVKYELVPKRSHLMLRGPKGQQFIVGGLGSKGASKSWVVRNTVANVRRMMASEYKG